MANTTFPVEVRSLFPKLDPAISGRELTRNVLVQNYLEILNDIYDTNIISPDQSLEKVEALTAITDPELRGAALACLGGVYTFAGNYIKASSAFDQALALVKKPDLLAVVYSEASMLIRKLGFQEEALAVLDQALRLTKDDKLTWRLKTQKGLCYKYAESDLAIKLLSECMDHYKKEKNHKRMARINRHLGLTYVHRGEFDEAEKSFNTALETAVEKGFEGLQNEIMNDKGWMMVLQNKFDQARNVFDKLLMENLSPYLKSLVLQNIAYLEFERENYKEAIKLHAQSLRLTTLYEMRDMAFEDFYKLGISHEAIGEVGLADHFFREGYLEIQKEIDLGLRLSGYRRKLLSAYVEFLNKHQKIPFLEMDEEVFGFALGKSLREIRNIFHSSLLSLHLERSKNAPAMCRHLDIDTRTYFIYQKKLDLKRGRPRKGPFLDNPRFSQYVDSLTRLTWKEANKEFERNLFDFMMAKFQSNKTLIAKELRVSYAQVVQKTKK